jgi:hypothetical protein
MLFGPWGVTTRDLVERMAEKYRVGTSVTVHYDPVDPGNSPLDTSLDTAKETARET